MAQGDLRMDCYPVYQYLINGHRSFFFFGAVLDSCFEFRSKFQVLSFSLIRRTGNHIAHALATALHLLCNEGVSLPSGLII